MSSILTKLKRLGLYLKFYFEPNEKALGAEASKAWKAYSASRPVLSSNNPKPHPSAYSRRQEESTAFHRGYKNTYRHLHAKQRLESLK